LGRVVSQQPANLVYWLAHKWIADRRRAHNYGRETGTIVRRE
jgi:hypothetical protein